MQRQTMRAAFRGTLAAIVLTAPLTALLAAAEPELVGLLAVALEEQVAREIRLSPAQRERLLDVIDGREAAAVDLAQRIRALSAAERAARLAEFRQQSERAGLALLVPAQRQRLREIVKERGAADMPADAAVAPVAERAESPAESPPPAENAPAGEEAPDLSGERAAAAPPSADDPGPPEDSSAPESPAEPRIAGPAVPEAMPQPEAALPEAVTIGAAGDTPAAGTPPEPAGDGLLRFSFRYQPWGDVLDWFASQADLSLAIDAPPPGTFNYTDPRAYTPAEALDLINSVLLTKGYTLVRRERMLMLVNLDDGIPPNMVPDVDSADLDELGRYELVRTLFRVEKMTPEEARTEIEKLLGPQGKIVVLPKARQLQVTETAGRLRTIRRVIDAVERPESTAGGAVREFPLTHVLPEEALPVLRQLLDLPEESDAAPDGSLRIAVDVRGDRLLASGLSHRLAQLEEVLRAVDVPALGDGRSALPETAQLEVYPVTAADPEAVLSVLQTLLAGDPDARLATDPATGNLVALARPTQHATIRATLDQMQRDARQIDVIRLASVDPQLAVLAINKLFGSGGETPNPTAPLVDADPITRTLLVRASAAQIEQIRSLLAKLGESDSADTIGSRGNVRMLPQGGRAAERTLAQIEALWPTVGKNRIRVVTPSSVVPVLRSGAIREKGALAPPRDEPRPAPLPPQRPDRGRERPPRENPVPPGAEPPAEKSTAAPPRRRIPARFASQPDTQPAERPAAAATAGGDLPPIVVAPGPGGTMIASEDLEALDRFESLWNTVAGRGGGEREFTVFYLKFGKATVIAETLTEIFGGGGGTGGGGGGGLLGDLAGAALGDLGGGLMGDLLGLGGGGTIATSGSVDIVADPRLNALIVQAQPADLELVEQLLQVLDQQTSPEDVQVAARPQLIPVYNTSAREIATVVQQVYRDRLIGSGGQQRQPSPEELIRALRGGRGRGGSESRESEVQKMSLGVDPRSNSLIVSAPPPLFEEVKLLVAQLDQADFDSESTARVVTLKRANPESVSRALAAILGDQVQTSTSPAPASGQARPAGQSRPQGTQQQGGDAAAARAKAASEMKARIEFLDRLRREAESRGRGAAGAAPGGRGGFPDRGGPQRPRGGR